MVHSTPMEEREEEVNVRLAKSMAVVEERLRRIRLKLFRSQNQRRTG
jgi:hypothetical protein